MGTNGRRLEKLEQQTGRRNHGGVYGHIIFHGIDRTLEILKEWREADEKGILLKEPPPFGINSDTESQLLRDLRML